MNHPKTEDNCTEEFKGSITTTPVGLALSKKDSVEAEFALTIKLYILEYVKDGEGNIYNAIDNACAVMGAVKQEVVGGSPMLTGKVSQ